MDDKNEQWKFGGNCKFCRRAEYCKKQCRENKNFMQGVMASVLAETKLGQMMKVVCLETEQDDG